MTHRPPLVYGNVRYDECQADLQSYDARFATKPPALLPAPTRAAGSPRATSRTASNGSGNRSNERSPDRGLLLGPPTHPRRWAKWTRPPGTAPDDVFWHRELLCRYF